MVEIAPACGGEGDGARPRGGAGHGQCVPEGQFTRGTGTRRAAGSQGVHHGQPVRRSVKTSKCKELHSSSRRPSFQGAWLRHSNPGSLSSLWMKWQCQCKLAAGDARELPCTHPNARAIRRANADSAPRRTAGMHSKPHLCRGTSGPRRGCAHRCGRCRFPRQLLARRLSQRIRPPTIGSFSYSSSAASQ